MILEVCSINKDDFSSEFYDNDKCYPINKHARTNLNDLPITKTEFYIE